MYSANTGKDKDLSIYRALVLLRLCFALLGTGYIHPDEYFQNGEVVAGRVLDVHTWMTWEWDPHFPVRSVLPVWLTTGIPLTVAQLLSEGSPLSPRNIFVAERLSFLCSSFFLDYAVYHLVQESSRRRALVLLGSSYVIHTFQVRPFTNALEAILVALSLLLLRRLLVLEGMRSDIKTVAAYTAALAFVAVSGLFTRITFATFFLPVALVVLNWSLRQAQFSLLPWARLVSPPLVVAALTGLGFAYADTKHFTSPSRTTIVGLTLAPLNFLRYNLSPSNLAKHGLHPRWLHLIVNLPMIATPGLLFYTLWADLDYSRMGDKGKEKDERWGRRGMIETMQKLFSWVRWSGITFLSIQPHQEPRFLIPLVVPMIALVVNNGRILRAGKWFWVTWTVWNLALAILFGVLHQGGVVPSLFRIHDIIYEPVNGTASHDFLVVYWQTYMPPRHLMTINNEDVHSHAVTILAYGSTPVEDVFQSLPELLQSDKRLSALLVAPFHALRQFDDAQRSCVSERGRIFPHLDLDHLAETAEAGWREGLSLGIFDMDLVCLYSHLHPVVL